MLKAVRLGRNAGSKNKDLAIWCSAGMDAAPYRLFCVCFQRKNEILNYTGRGFLSAITNRSRRGSVYTLQNASSNQPTLFLEHLSAVVLLTDIGKIESICVQLVTAVGGERFGIVAKEEDLQLRHTPPNQASDPRPPCGGPL